MFIIVLYKAFWAFACFMFIIVLYRLGSNMTGSF